jgi:hypothetical protein
MPSTHRSLAAPGRASGTPSGSRAEIPIALFNRSSVGRHADPAYLTIPRRRKLAGRTAIEQSFSATDICVQPRRTMTPAEGR